MIKDEQFMKKEIVINGKRLQYDYTVKKVKNINLRIRTDGSISVSSSAFVRERDIEDFLISKGDFILKAMDRFQAEKQLPTTKYYEEEELKSLILSLCKEIYPYFEKMGIEYPEIKFRKMKSQWGSCYPKKHRLTFSTNLMYVPFECIEYVVCHEFTHFIVANHSHKFYEELSKICPRWKSLKKTLKTCGF